MSGSTSYTPTQISDVVAVYDVNFNQIFTKARPIKASVKEKAKVMKHPVETGATVADFRVIEPVQIDLHMILIGGEDSYIDTYEDIKQQFLSSNLIQVQTNTGLYENMTISNMPHEEDPASFDVIKLTLSLEEVIFALTSTSQLPATMTTKSGGNKNGNPANSAQTGEATTKAQNSAAYTLIYGGK